MKLRVIVGVLENGVPRSGVEAQASRPTGDDGDFAFEGEDVAEVVELDVDFGGHGGRACGVSVEVGGAIETRTSNNWEVERDRENDGCG